jgi:hypothetical protein
MHNGNARRPPGKRSASASAREPKRQLSRTASPTDRETATGRGLVSPITDRHRVPAQDLTFLASDLGQVVAQVFLHVRISRFRAAFADAQQLVRKHPLQAVLVGVGLGYLFSRKVK